MPIECEFCRPDILAVLEASDTFWLTRNAGGFVLAPRAHVRRWADLDPPARAALAEGIAAAQARAGDGAPAAVRFDELGPHMHIVIGAEPGAVAAEVDLLDGPEEALLRRLRPSVDAASSVDAAVAFALRSGVDLLFPHFEDLLDRGGRLRLLVGDYMGASDPEALRRLLDLPDGAELLAFEAKTRAFHPKCWLIAEADGGGALIVGSSNLSASGLETGVEWNLRLRCAP